MNTNSFIKDDGKFDIESFKKVIRNAYIEHAIIVDSEGKLFSYTYGNKTSANFMGKVIRFLEESNFSGKILLSEDEALRRYGDKVALSDEALEYLKTKLRGGQLIHNHPEHSALTQTDIMTALYLDLGRVEALCKDGTDYILEIDVDKRMSTKTLSILKKKLSENEEMYLYLRSKNIDSDSHALYYIMEGTMVKFDSEKFKYYMEVSE